MILECLDVLLFCLKIRYTVTTVFIDTRLWKAKHPRKRFQNLRQSCVILTDWIDFHQLQPLVWPSNLLYVMLLGCDWWILIQSANNMQDWRKYWKRFCECFVFRINKNGGNKKSFSFYFLISTLHFRMLFCTFRKKGLGPLETHCYTEVRHQFLQQKERYLKRSMKVERDLFTCQIE